MISKLLFLVTYLLFVFLLVTYPKDILQESPTVGLKLISSEMDLISSNRALK